MSTQVFECPKCSAQQPEKLANGTKLYNCPSCGQAIHPPKCDCPECDMRQLKAELDLGLTALAGMKAIRAKDEAERLRLGLPLRDSFQGGKVAGVITVNGEIATKCHNCGHQWCTKKFCPKCGHQVTGDCPRCSLSQSS